MSKTTLKKKTKKPTHVRQWTNNELMKALTADHDGLELKLIAIQGSVDMLGQRIDAMRHEQFALSQESRSAPAEEVDGLGVFPKHQPGDLVIHVLVGGALHTVREVAQQGMMVYLDSDPGCVPAGWYRKPTEAEVAEYKAKEERQKELAKPLEFGTRVKWDTSTGRVACEGPDHENQYLVAYKPGNGSVWHSTWVWRRDLTILDQPSDR